MSVRVATVGSLPLQRPIVLGTAQGFVCEDSSVKDLEGLVLEHSRAVIEFQDRLGVDIVSEGDLVRSEPGRANWGSAYIYYFARFIQGFAHDYAGTVPHVEGKIRGVRTRPIVEDFARAQRFTNKPVKVSLPGPSTMVRRTENHFYKNANELAVNYATALQKQVEALIAAGCKWIQFDDPHILWNNDGWALTLLNAIVQQSGRPDVHFVLHMCRGNTYSYKGLEHTEANQAYYSGFMPQLAASKLDYLSLERPSTPDGSYQLEGFSRGVMMGLMDVSREDCEGVDELTEQILRVHDSMPGSDLIVSQDCGLKHMTMDVAERKIRALVEAAKGANEELAARNQECVAQERAVQKLAS